MLDHMRASSPQLGKRLFTIGKNLAEWWIVEMSEVRPRLRQDPVRRIAVAMRAFLALTPA